jgi:SAM-dependent methyltransferase
MARLTDEAVVDLILEHLPPGGRVLDVGCGRGHMLATLARRGVLGTGVDPYGCWGVLCERLHAEQIGSLQEQFDLIYTLYALHEFDVPVRFLRQAKHVLRADGVLLIMDWVHRAEKGVRDCYLAIETVAQYMADAGFNVLRQEVCGQTMVLVGRMAICQGTPRDSHGVQIEPAKHCCPETHKEGNQWCTDTMVGS